MRRLLAMGAMALTLATGCQPGVQPTMPTLAHQLVGRPAYLVTGAASDQHEFTDLLSRQGITLTDAQLKAIAQATTVLPSGQWSTQSSASLQEQWQQFGTTVTPGFDSPDAYRSAAVQFAKKRDASVGFYFDTETFRQNGQVHVPHWDVVQGQWVDLAADGGIETYKPRTAEPTTTYLRVPQTMMPGAR